MKRDRSRTSSRNRFARSEWLKLALAAWLFAVSLTALSNTSSGVSSARSGAAPSAPLASIVVNTTGDGDNIDASAGCDADAATPGEQCTLRAAIQRANTAAGDDTITFNIPATEPNCDAGTGACTINLTKALPDLNTNVAINGPGVDKLTVRRGSGDSYRVFTGRFPAQSLTFSGLTISAGFTTGFGGGIGVFGSSTTNITLNVADCKISNNFANQSGGGISVPPIAPAVSRLNISNTVFSGNIAIENGGGVFGIGDVSNSTFNNNVAGDAGGGMAGVVNITSGVFTGNSAHSGGGAALGQGPHRGRRRRGDAGY